MINKGSIIIPSFPEITINEDDKNEAEELEIKKIVFEWMKQIICTTESEKTLEYPNSDQGIDEDNQIIREENIETSDYSISNLIIQQNEKKQRKLTIINVKDDENKLENFYEQFDSLITEFIKMRNPLLKNMAKGAIKSKMINDLKKVIEIVLNEDRFSLCHSLSEIDYKKCMEGPNSFKYEKNQECNEIDILENRYDFENDDELDD